jgi:hypothetical protein
MTFAVKERSDIFKFLTRASDQDFLIQVKKEVEGRNDEDDEEEAEVSEEETRRKPSPTLKELIEEYHECEARASHHTCTISFVEENMKALDFGHGKEALDRLSFWLTKLQLIIEASNNVKSAAIKNAFSSYTSLANVYYRNLPADRTWAPPLALWRDKIKVSKLVSIQVMANKEKVLLEKLSNKYEESFDRCASVANRWKRESEIEPMTRKKAVQLALAVEMSAGCRKTAVYDASIEFYTWQDWSHLNGFDEEVAFKFGLDNSKIAIPDLNRVLDSFGRQYILVQKGILKAKGEERNNKFLEDESLHVEGSSVRKPTIIFTAKEVVAMIKQVRAYFQLTKANRPTGPKARVKLGALVSSRDISPIIQKDFPQSLAHAKRYGWSISSHHMRKIYSQSAATIYEHQIFQATGKKIDRQVIVAAWLAHGGSFQTASSYANVEMSFEMKPPVLKSPDAHQLRLVLEEIRSFKEQYITLAQHVNDLEKALSKKKFRRIRLLVKQKVTPEQKKVLLDDRIHDVLHEQKTEFGIDPELVRYPKGINRSRWLEFFKRKRRQNEPLLPPGYIPTNKRPKKRARDEPEDKAVEEAAEEKGDEVMGVLGVKRFKSGSSHAWVIPENQSENTRRNWLRRAKETDGRTTENGGLILAENCVGRKRTIQIVGKERVECVEHK